MIDYAGRGEHVELLLKKIQDMSDANWKNGSGLGRRGYRYCRGSVGGGHQPFRQMEKQPRYGNLQRIILKGDVTQPRNSHIGAGSQVRPGGRGGFPLPGRLPILSARWTISRWKAARRLPRRWPMRCTSSAGRCIPSIFIADVASFCLSEGYGNGAGNICGLSTDAPKRKTSWNPCPGSSASI